MHVKGDAIANCVLETFAALPAKAKPRQYHDGSKEWVPLSGIVLSRNFESSGAETTVNNHVLTCVALGTGMRCLPANRIHLANGRCLHDWHAEIVAIRAFNLFLIDECALLAADSGASSDFVRRRTDREWFGQSYQPFALKEDVRIFMYCTEVPCGDASMEFTMSSQHDQTPWTATPVSKPGSSLLNGRGYFGELGVVRRKPSRGDAPETLSKSCSDKLCMVQCTSLLSSLSCLLLDPQNAYLHALVLPASQYVERAICRAFNTAGRMAPLIQSDGSCMIWSGGYAFRPFQVTTTSAAFCFSRHDALPAAKATGSNISAMWTPRQQEVLIGGVIQGHKQFSRAGSSAISRTKLWKAVSDTVQLLAIPTLTAALSQSRYSDLKQSSILSCRRRVKQDVKDKALKNWVSNSHSDDFALDETIVL